MNAVAAAAILVNNWAFLRHDAFDHVAVGEATFVNGLPRLTLRVLLPAICAMYTNRFGTVVAFPAAGDLLLDVQSSVLRCGQF